MAQNTIDVKLREARIHFNGLREIVRADEFYALANAFLTSARSVLFVAQHQHGWKERLRGIPSSPGEESERRRFDQWFEKSNEAHAVLTHPLASDRRDVIHRSGQARFIHIPKPGGGGIALNHGTPFEQSLWFTRRGIGGLPLCDDNYFYYLHEQGNKSDAIPFAEEFLNLVAVFAAAVSKRPWAAP